MDGYTGRSRWWVLFIAGCISLPFQVWADTEMSEKIRFEKQAQAHAIAQATAAEAAAEASIPAEQTSLTGKQPVTGQDIQEEEYFADAEFEDDVFIELKDGVLSVDVQDVPFNTVLTTVAEQGEFRVLFVDPAQEPISIAFADLPLKKGIEELLRERAYIFRYSGDKGALSTVVVYARKADPPNQAKNRRSPPQPTDKREGDLAGQADPNEPAVTLLSAQALDSSYEDERLEAVEGLDFLENQEEVAEVLTAVLQGDDNSDVREAALESLADFDDPDSQRRAAHLSIHDAEQAIRMRAVEILTDIEDWDTLRDVATSHDDPQVRERASHALEDMGN